MSDGTDFTPEQVELIKGLCASQSLTDDEFALFLHVARMRGLNPLFREIHAVKRKERGGGEGRMTIQVGIDGSRKLAEATGRYCPGETTFQETPDGRLISATVTVYKLFTVAGSHEWRGISAVAFYREYVQTRWSQEEGKHVPVSMWAKMPRNQLAKCAEALALRKAFPQLSGLYVDEEMEQADHEERRAVQPEPAAVAEPPWTLPAPAIAVSVQDRAQFERVADGLDNAMRLAAQENARRVAAARAAGNTMPAIEGMAPAPLPAERLQPPADRQPPIVRTVAEAIAGKPLPDELFADPVAQLEKDLRASLPDLFQAELLELQQLPPASPDAGTEEKQRRQVQEQLRAKHRGCKIWTPEEQAQTIAWLSVTPAGYPVWMRFLAVSLVLDKLAQDRKAAIEGRPR